MERERPFSLSYLSLSVSPTVVSWRRRRLYSLEPTLSSAEAECIATALIRKAEEEEEEEEEEETKARR